MDVVFRTVKRLSGRQDCEKDSGLSCPLFLPRYTLFFHMMILIKVAKAILNHLVIIFR